MSDPIIYPLDQKNYFEKTLFYQYLGSEEGSENIRKYINPAYTDASNGIEYIYQSILDSYKVDSAVGASLDIIGRIVGLARPTFSQIGLVGFFGYDGPPNNPFDNGEFADGRVSPEDGLVNDDKYRGLIKVKIVKNVWDGTRPSLKALLNLTLDADMIYIKNTDPATFDITFVGGAVSEDDVNALKLLDLIPTPQGVSLGNVYITENAVFTLEDGSIFKIEDDSVFTVRREKL